ncbi:MAG: Smr/MutS family protein [Desulfatiglandaceae bacterium]|jgi:DNA-nicking Smr family endonuclease
MARKKKKRKHKGKALGGKKEDVFNPALQGKVVLPGDNLSDSPATGRPLPPADFHLEEDERLFLVAMDGVEPLSSAHKRVVPLPKLDTRPAHPAPDDELEAMTHLSELVSGSAKLDITYSDEYLEGSVQGFDPRLMQRLKRGQFPIQDFIDLHGLTKQEAQMKVRDFVLKSYHIGLRCILVVHGRGLNSENHIPVLKERLPLWLTRGPARKIVLAFSTAKPYDGGTGALYILLKKKRGVS